MFCYRRSEVEIIIEVVECFWLLLLLLLCHCLFLLLLFLGYCHSALFLTIEVELGLASTIIHEILHVIHFEFRLIFFIQDDLRGTSLALNSMFLFHDLKLF